MSKDYRNTLGEVAPGSQNPEVAVNDALRKTELALNELVLPDGGTPGQILAIDTDGTTLHWTDPPSGGGSADFPAGGTAHQFLQLQTDGSVAWADIPAELPTGGVNGQILTRTASGVAWADAPAGTGTGGGSSGGSTTLGMMTPRAASYWRLRQLKGNSANNVALTDLIFATVAGGSQAATGGTATASSVYGASYPATNAFDGDVNSAWFSASGASIGEWIQYQFPTPILPAEIRVLNNAGNQYSPTSAALDFSDDGKTWFTALLIEFPAFVNGTYQTITVKGSGGLATVGGSLVKPPKVADFPDLATAASGAVTATDDADAGLVASITPQTGDKVSCLFKTVPASGDWQFVTRVRIHQVNVNFGATGLILFNTAWNLLFGVDHAGSQNNLVLNKYSANGTGYNQNFFSLNSPQRWQWYKVTYNATTDTYGFSISDDGIVWNEMFNSTSAGIGGKITKVGLGFAANYAASGNMSNYKFKLSCPYWSQSW